MINIPNYKIIKSLGEGGMGTVYLAEHELIGRQVAIKSLHSNLTSNEQFILRFRREAKLLASLDHPNIVRLNEYIEHEGRFFLIMEYVAGSELNTYINKVIGGIPEKKLIILFSKILDAIAYAHRKGMIHRDLKPSNIIITKDESVKILDFGIAKLVKENKELTKSGVQVGTVRYMSPEQVRAKKVDKLTDIYSLGVILFQMAVGKAPYNNISAFDTQLKIVNESLPKAQDDYSKVSNKIQSIIDKATQKEKKDRYLNCEDFLEALNNDELIVKSSVKKKNLKNQDSKKNEFVKNDLKSDNPKNKSKNNLIPTLFFIVMILVVFLIKKPLFQTNGKDNQETTPSKIALSYLKKQQIVQIKEWEDSNKIWNIGWIKLEYSKDKQGYIKELAKWKKDCIENKNCNRWTNNKGTQLVYTAAKVIYHRTKPNEILSKGADNFPVKSKEKKSSSHKSIHNIKSFNNYTYKVSSYKKKILNEAGRDLIKNFLKSKDLNIPKSFEKVHLFNSKYLMLETSSWRKPYVYVVDLNSRSLIFKGEMKGTPYNWEYCKKNNIIFSSQNTDMTKIKSYIDLKDGSYKSSKRKFKPLWGIYNKGSHILAWWKE